MSSAAGIPSEADIISTRLVTHESVVGGKSASIHAMSKAFFSFSETSQAVADDAEGGMAKKNAAYEHSLKEIQRFLLDASHSSLILQTCKREQQRYLEASEETTDAIQQAKQDIEDLKTQLKNERLVRQQKEDYETLATLINKHRPRDELEQEIAGLKESLGKLEAENGAVGEQIEQRRKQFALFFQCLQDLSTGWDDEEHDALGEAVMADSSSSGGSDSKAGKESSNSDAAVADDRGAAAEEDSDGDVVMS